MVCTCSEQVADREQMRLAVQPVIEIVRPYI